MIQTKQMKTGSYLSTQNLRFVSEAEVDVEFFELVKASKDTSASHTTDHVGSCASTSMQSMLQLNSTSLLNRLEVQNETKNRDSWTENQTQRPLCHFAGTAQHTELFTLNSQLHQPQTRY